MDMQMTKIPFLRATLAALLALPLLPACGSSASSICGDVCDCVGCSESEEKDCVDAVEDQQQEAEAEGCGDQVSALIDCYGSELECREDRVDVDGCDSEEEAVSDCSGGFAGFVGGACQRLKGCCVAYAAQAGYDESTCDAYDQADDDACEAVIANFEQSVPEGSEIPSACRF
jgi:hypothetical protein